MYQPIINDPNLELKQFVKGLDSYLYGIFRSKRYFGFREKRRNSSENYRLYDYARSLLNVNVANKNERGMLGIVV